MKKLVKALACFWTDRRGAATSEQALLLAVIAIGLAAGAAALGLAISDGIDPTGTFIKSGTTQVP